MNIIDKVYEFWYSDCIYGSADACMSLHQTKKGAEIAMNFHKELKRKEWEMLYEDDCYGKFDEMREWGVRNRDIFE